MRNVVHRGESSFRCFTGIFGSGIGVELENSKEIQTSNSNSWERELLEQADAVRQRAYAPFSQFLVGAALLDVEGRIFVGCNVENSSYGATICAERVAACSAVAAGSRIWRAIAIVTVNSAMPCGICRQFLNELAPDLTVLAAASCNLRAFDRIPLTQLLPNSFSREDLR